MWKQQAHKGFVRGICFSPYDGNVVTVGDDKTIKIWKKPLRGGDTSDEDPLSAVFKSKSILK